MPVPVHPCVKHRFSVHTKMDQVKEKAEFQRPALPGEPTCIICGRFAEYICDSTNADVCSLECKGKHISRTNQSSLPRPASSPSEYLTGQLLLNIDRPLSSLELAALPVVRHCAFVRILADQSECRSTSVLLPLIQRVCDSCTVPPTQRVLVLVRSAAAAVQLEALAKKYAAGVADCRTARLCGNEPAPCQVCPHFGVSPQSPPTDGLRNAQTDSIAV